MTYECVCIAYILDLTCMSIDLRVSSPDHVVNICLKRPEELQSLALRPTPASSPACRLLASVTKISIVYYPSSHLNAHVICGHTDVKVDARQFKPETWQQNGSCCMLLR